MSIQEAMNNGVGAKILITVLSGLLIAAITSFWSLSNSVSTLSAQQESTQEQISRFDDRITDRISSFEDRLSYMERRKLEEYENRANSGD